MSSIEGLDEILAKISGLGGNIEEVCYNATIRGCKTIQRNAKLLCPVGITGQLRNSIKVRAEIKQGEVMGEIYSNSDHWYPEFGTGPRGRESNIERPEGISYSEGWKRKRKDNKPSDWKGQSAQPFMTPAYLHAKKTGDAQQEIAKAIQTELRKLGG